jgi:hypothetical protein
MHNKICVSNIEVVMKTKLIILGILVVLLCALSITQFSQKEGYSFSYNDYYSKLNYNTIAAGSSKGNVKVYGNGKSMSGNNNDPFWKKDVDISIYRDYPAVIVQSNLDFMNAVNARLTSEPNVEKDKKAIYNIQTGLASIHSKNAATLLGEIGDNNNISNPRLFLQYMNWFGSNCPVDSDDCPGFAN